MMNRALFLFLLMTNNSAWPDAPYPGLQVEVKRQGDLYTLIASFETPLSKCAAYHYLTDYDAAKYLPGVIKSSASRQSANQVEVDRTDDERILFFHIHLRSVMEFKEKPFDGISFTQLTGDSKMFQGSWDIEPNKEGSTLKFKGLWEPDSLFLLFIIDHFAKNGLIDRFSAIAQLAEQRKDKLATSCAI